MDDILNPFLGFTDMAKVFVGLKELALFVHPVAPFPTVASGLLALAAITSIGSLQSSSTAQANNFLRR
jgi:hypothetical protein